MNTPRQHPEATTLGRQYRSYEDIPNIPDRLRWCRHKLKLTQKEAAGQLGLSAYVYKDLESGRKHIPEEMAQQLAEFYGIPAEDLMDGYCRFQSAGQAQEIRKLRKSLQMTQAAFAAHLGAPLSSLQAWEAGKKIISRKSWELYFSRREL